MLATRKSKLLDLNMVMLKSWVMPLKQLWSNFSNLLKMFKKLELFILSVNPKMDLIQKCLLTQLINTLSLSRDNKDLIIIMSVILKELLKKYGNIAIECYMKENTKQLTLNKERNLML
jgi:hypothetical protein